jgi:hypothetical protein
MQRACRDTEGRFGFEAVGQTPQQTGMKGQRNRMAKENFEL